MEELKNKFVIVRADRAGVFFGKLKNYDAVTCTVELTECRRLWYWDGAASISQLAAEGTVAPRNCRFTVTVSLIVITGVIEIIECSDKAVRSINSVAVWKE